ncbi:MAG: ABC transporter permease, partial [Candidatus Bipolaricaulota bacterium]|nr:ABC transporter permease [Candidatus Bipolaricaulota bacterium]
IPNILPLSFLYMMFTVTSAIFSEAVLSFFGLVDIKMSWGLMINITRDAGYLGATNLMQFWWLWLPAGSCITALCAAFYLVGRGLDEIVNPRLRQR